MCVCMRVCVYVCACMCGCVCVRVGVRVRVETCQYTLNDASVPAIASCYNMRKGCVERESRAGDGANGGGATDHPHPRCHGNDFA